jgi:hypothetical protein
MTTTFRAAYFIAADGQSDVLLTDETMAALSDEDLIAEAKALADQIGLDVGEGRIEVGAYTR